MNLQPTPLCLSHPRLNLGGSTLPQPTSCGPDWWHILQICGEHRGSKNSWLTTTTSLAKPNILSRKTEPTLPFLAPGDATKCKHWPQHSSTSPGDTQDTTPTSSSSSSALGGSSGDKLLPGVLQWSLHASVSVNLPSPTSSWGSCLPYAVRHVLKLACLIKG